MTYSDTSCMLFLSQFQLPGRRCRMDGGLCSTGTDVVRGLYEVKKQEGSCRCIQGRDYNTKPWNLNGTERQMILGKVFVSVIRWQDQWFQVLVVWGIWGIRVLKAMNPKRRWSENSGSEAEMGMQLLTMARSRIRLRQCWQRSVKDKTHRGRSSKPQRGLVIGICVYELESPRIEIQVVLEERLTVSWELRALSPRRLSGGWWAGGVCQWLQKRKDDGWQSGNMRWKARLLRCEVEGRLCRIGRHWLCWST